MHENQTYWEKLVVRTFGLVLSNIQGKASNKKQATKKNGVRK